MFETIQDLSKLTLEISAYDRNEPEAIYLGKAAIDLHTIATGPSSQDIQLERQVGSPAGRVVFIVEMAEYCSNLICCISNINLIIQQSTLPSSTKAKMEIFFSERQDIRNCSEVADIYDLLKVRCQTIEPLPIQASVVDLENSFVYIVIFLGSSKDDKELVWSEIGRCRLSLAHYHPANSDMQLFHENVVCHNIHDLLQINGTVLFMNGPTMAQMLSGSNTEYGVHPGPLSWPDIEVPRNCLDEIPKNGVGLDRFASLRSSICWRVPTIPYDESDLLIMGKQRKWTPDECVQTLPRGWSMSIDSEGFLFFRYHPTKQATWSDPRYLPPGWEQSMTLDGKVFFYSYAAKSSTWIDPRGLPLEWDLILESGSHTIKPMFSYRGMMTTIDPRGLPSRYSQHLDPHGAVYYKDHQLKATSWDDPRALMTLTECLQVVEDYIDAFNQAKLKMIKAESSMRKVNGRAQDILLQMDNEISGFRSWYETNEKQWLLEKEQREENDLKKIRDAELKLKAMRQKNSETLAKLEEKWKKDLEDKKEAILAQYEYNEQELLKAINDVKKQIESDRQQWVEDMIEMKKFATRDRMKKCTKNRKLLQQELMDWIREENEKSRLECNEPSASLSKPEGNSCSMAQDVVSVDRTTGSESVAAINKESGEINPDYINKGTEEYNSNGITEEVS